METLSAREYTMFEFVKLLSNWREQRPSKRDDLESSVTEKVGRVYYMEVDLFLI
jgi:hypothetical protein